MLKFTLPYNWNSPIVAMLQCDPAGHDAFPFKIYQENDDKVFMFVY